MKRLWHIVVLLSSVESQVRYLTPSHLGHLNELKNVAVFDDAEARGPPFYDTSEADHSSVESTIDSTQSSSSISDEDKTEEEKSEDASSVETKESDHRYFRTCTPCPADMLKKWSNKGIKWICGRYQRARRTFKSECMMRFRNCQDGTMFVKSNDGKCQDNPFNGRHWFYVYGV